MPWGPGLKSHGSLVVEYHYYNIIPMVVGVRWGKIANPGCRHLNPIVLKELFFKMQGNHHKSG